jgi:putative ribosome biogenesis GTPase RsgA
VCDLTRPETLNALHAYASDFLLVNPRAALVVLANKLDLVASRMISDQQVADLAEQYGVPWMLTSARTGEQVEAAFSQLGQHIYQRRRGS